MRTQVFANQYIDCTEVLFAHTSVNYQRSRIQLKNGRNHRSFYLREKNFMEKSMNKLLLEDEELTAIDSLLNEITAQYESVEDSEFLNVVATYAQEAPRRIRGFLNNLRLTEPASGACVISGYRVDEEQIGQTPSHWKFKSGVSQTLKEEIYLILLGMLLGEVIAWATQQDGHIVHDVMPIQSHEDEQLGSGSKQLLWWHSEDAFHTYRGDYLGMMCLRNPDNVATTYACIDMVNLSQRQIDLLFEPRYTIRPDESHDIKNGSELQRSETDQLRRLAYQHIDQLNNCPQRLSVLFGDKQSPYIRIDPYFMDRLSNDEEAQAALDTLVKSIDEKLTDQVLQPGDVIFIDNYRTVHGRRPFVARYDGRDRWLKRINIARDLRKSRSSRQFSWSRVIFG
jgi:Fe(II)/alpha-ketoglutarate-dependent arginine beta-hydroxylase